MIGKNFKGNLREKFFKQRVVDSWNSLPEQMVESLRLNRQSIEECRWENKAGMDMVGQRIYFCAVQFYDSRTNNLE